MNREIDKKKPCKSKTQKKGEILNRLQFYPFFGKNAIKLCDIMIWRHYSKKVISMLFPTNLSDFQFEILLKKNSTTLIVIKTSFEVFDFWSSLLNFSKNFYEPWHYTTFLKSKISKISLNIMQIRFQCIFLALLSIWWTIKRSFNKLFNKS